MNILVSVVFSGLTGALVIPSLVLFGEVFSAVFLRRSASAEKLGAARGSIAVLVPAHNESSGLIPTLEDIKRQLCVDDRLVVVADNCSDDTAAIAASCGAEVTVRSDPSRIGKGYALDWGVRYLTKKPPQTVIVIDADCRISLDALETLAVQSTTTARPAQALYLMTAPAEAKINYQVAEFAWRLRNWVRPLGLHNLGLPCQLMGTGMAFPWPVFRAAKLSSDALVEDLQLGLDLAALGYAPVFCPSALVTSTFPQSREGAEAQRQRWEHGHLGLISRRFLPSVVRSITHRNLFWFTLIIDLLVPPLSLMVIILSSATLLTALSIIFGGSMIAFAITLSCLALTGLAVGFAWFTFAREILPPRKLALIPVYMIAKLWPYLGALFGRKVSHWVRADRG
jgi:cellulose synthase/poly-beta-1,6-N-acetylglucosamine synthase-like glycosyltransferase